MKSLVLDGSTTLGFLLKDELSPHSLKALETMSRSPSTYVPSHWLLETANGLLMAERRRRASPAEITEAFNLALTLPVITDEQTASRCSGDTPALARQYALTIYDAAYLELAMRRGSILATADKVLAKAALAAGVEILA